MICKTLRIKYLIRIKEAESYIETASFIYLIKRVY